MQNALFEANSAAMEGGVVQMEVSPWTYVLGMRPTSAAQAWRSNLPRGQHLTKGLSQEYVDQAKR